MQYILLLLPAVVVGFIAYMRQKSITGKEFVLMFVGSALVATFGYYWAKHNALQDTEYWNGRISHKDNGIQSCCHCSTVCDSRDKDGRCTSEHEDCDHVLDHWWSVSLTTGDEIKDGCNGSAFAVPSWWTDAEVGMPASYPHTYTNYLRADPESLKTPQTAKYMGKVPAFPEPDCPYCQRHVVAPDSFFPPSWEGEMDALNADLGRRLQVDAYILPTFVTDPAFADAVKAKWVYGPKNAVTIVLGIQDDKIAWVDVVSLSDIPAFRVRLRQDLLGRSIYEGVVDTIRDHLDREYTRTPMATYSYLASAVTIPTWMMFLLMLINTAISCIIAAYMAENDVFNEEWQPRRHRRF